MVQKPGSDARWVKLHLTPGPSSLGAEKWLRLCVQLHGSRYVEAGWVRVSTGAAIRCEGLGRCRFDAATGIESGTARSSERSQPTRPQHGPRSIDETCVHELTLQVSIRALDRRNCVAEPSRRLLQTVVLHEHCVPSDVSHHVHAKTLRRARHEIPERVEDNCQPPSPEPREATLPVLERCIATARTIVGILFAASVRPPGSRIEEQERKVRPVDISLSCDSRSHLRGVQLQMSCAGRSVDSPLDFG